MTENRAEFDFKIFTGVTLFDDIPDSDFDNVNAKRSSVDSANEAGDSVDESNLSASDKAKNWFHEHYMSLLSYHQQRATRVTEFYVELNDTTASPMSREEKKTMEIEFYQKETTYLRMKRKTKQEEFEPLFKFTQPNGAIIMPVTPAPNKKQQHQQQQQQQQESTATSKSPLSASYPTTPNHNTGSTGNLRSLLIGNNRSPFNSNENLTGTVRFDTKNVRFADTDCIPTSPPSNDEFDRSQVRRTKSISSINKSTPTPLKNKSFTMMFNLDNKTKLEQTQKLLQEKEEDTRIAAEIGKSLLDANEELEIEVKSLRQRNIDQSEKIRMTLDELDRYRTEMVLLAARLESATRDNVELELALNRQAEEKEWRRIESPHNKLIMSKQLHEIEQLKQTLESVQESEDRLKRNRDRLAEQNESLHHSVADLQSALDDKVDQEQYEAITGQVKLLRDKNRKLRERLKEMERDNGALMVEPSLIIKSAFQDLIKNEELLMATPKMANLRVIQDAKLLLRELENEVKGNLECSLINSLIKFLERDTTSDSQAQLQQVAALTLNESFESNTDQEVADPKSALYMLVCVVSIYKYTRYDKQRIENDSNTIDELGSQVEALKKMITNLEFDLGEAKMLNSKLEEDIDLLKTPQPHHMSMADELRSAFQQDDTSKEKLRDEYDSQILQLNQENLQYALEIESLRQQLLNQEESAKKLRAQLELELARQTAELNKTIELKSNEIDELVRQKEIALDEHSRLINEKQQSIEQLTVDVQSKVVDIQKLDGQVKELENSLSQTNQILIDKEMAIDRFINEVEQKDKQLQERDEQLHESMCEIRNRDEQLQDLSNRINEKDSLIKENTVIIDKLNESVSENQLVIEQLGQKNKQNEDLVKRLELDNEEKQSALEKLVVDVKEKDVQINGLSESVQEKDRLSQRLTEEVEKKAEHLQKLSAENEEKQLLIEKITTENQVKQDSIVQLTEENANGVKEIKRLEQELDSLKLELSNGASANDADKTLIQQLRKEKAQLLESLESQKSADTLRITQLDQQLAQLQEQHQQFTEKINNSLQLNKTSLVSYDEYTNQQMNRIQQSLDINVNSRLNTLEQSVKETTEHNQHLHTQIQQLTKVNSEQSEMIATTLEKVNGLQQTNNELVEKNVHLQRKSDELFVDLEREKENASSLSTENAHLKEQIADLIKKLEAKSHKHGLAVKELSQQLFDMTELVKKTTEKEEVEMIALPDPQLVKDYSIVEESPLIRFINEKLPMTDEIKHVFPVDSSKHVKLAIYDGVLMCKLVNLAREGTIDERVMNMKPQNRIEVDQNFNLVCNSSRAIGCVIQNITPQAVQQDPHITLSLIYQLVRVYINSSINLNNYPNLLVFKSSDEDIKHFAAQSSSQLLLRWACYHLEIKKSKESVEQLLLKPLNCIKLLCKLDKELVPPSSSSSNEDESVLYEWILTETSNRFKIFPWLTLDTMKSKNEKLAYLFIASLFLSEKGIGITIEENETKEVTLLVKEVSDLVDVEGTREERAFCMWINSLNLSPYVNNLQQDLQDGLIILQMFDKIKPGSVNWKNVNQHPSNNYMEMENCNLGIDLARKLKFSLVGVGGRDIHEGNRKLTLALIWQACKYHLLSILASLRPVSSSGGNLSSSSKDVGESDIIRWANQKVTTIGKSTGIHGFKDGSVGNGLFLIDLLESMSRGCINYSIVTPGDTDENKKLNAQYIINVARKLDCCIFLVWEDIVEVKPKMILTLVAQLYIKSVIDV